MLAGVAPSVIKQLTKTHITDTIPLTDVFPATPVLGESMQQAQAAAEAWLLRSGRDEEYGAPQESGTTAEEA